MNTEAWYTSVYIWRFTAYDFCFQEYTKTLVKYTQCMKTLYNVNDYRFFFAIRNVEA